MHDGSEYSVHDSHPVHGKISIFTLRVDDQLSPPYQRATILDLVLTDALCTDHIIITSQYRDGYDTDNIEF